MVEKGKKRWKVSYTKHMTQKRKLYHDGFLLLHTSANKLELYDDCQKLLGVKIAKTDDAINSGETLAFSTYLVDIGDLEGDCKPVLNLNSQVRDNKVTEKKAGLLPPKKKFNPVFAGFGKNGAPSCSLSPSQKIIEEFKKNEILKYGGPRNSPDATKSSNTEWQVLYTTQKTQKAKKYHDGFLRMAACGSQGRQATLYDLNRTVLDSKFLKKDEVIESGKSLTFDGHLVDVGEPKGDHKPQSDLKARGKNSYTGENINPGSSCNTPQHNGLTAVKYTRREWHALYTNQVTQKAKKYHSGFLTLASSGSFQLQATLLTEDGTVLSRKFLKLSDNVNSGSSFQLSNYLVEVGEPRETPEEPPKHPFAGRDVKPTVCPRVSSEPKSNPVDKPLHGGEPTVNALSGRKVKSLLHPNVSPEPRKGDLIHKSLAGGEAPKDILSGRESNFHPIVDSSKPGKSDLVDKPLRGANDILSILRKSTMKQNSLPTKNISSEHHQCPQSSENVHSQFQNHEEKVGNSVSDRHGVDTQNMGEEVHDFSFLDSYVEHTGKNIVKPYSSNKEPQVKPEQQEPLQLENNSNGYTKAFIESMFSEDSTSCLSYGLPDEVNNKILAKPGEEGEMEIGKTSSECCNKRRKRMISQVLI